MSEYVTQHNTVLSILMNTCNINEWYVQVPSAPVSNVVGGDSADVESDSEKIDSDVTVEHVEDEEDEVDGEDGQDMDVEDEEDDDDDEDDDEDEGDDDDEDGDEEEVEEIGRAHV